MLSEIRPLLNDEVRHLLAPVRDVFGKLSEEQAFTSHSARIVMTPGAHSPSVSRERTADHAATIWLFNHPRPVRIGDIFILPDGEQLRATRIENRTAGRETLTKVFLT